MSSFSRTVEVAGSANAPSIACRRGVGSGDAVINLLVGGTTRMIVRDFSARIPVLPQDDSAPSWWSSQPVQTSKGGFNIRHILKGYDPAAGYDVVVDSLRASQ